MSTDYKELAAWKQAMGLVKEIYRCTRSFPREELFGLRSQMQRAAVSVPSNIAEGKGRYSRKELVQFLYKARGSLMELETQVCIARDLGYIDDYTGRGLSTKVLEVARILNGLINRFQQEIQGQPPTTCHP
ncbi:MAG: four helix bundle protein [Acidobacteriia bacterium]|nr:four helix bundle protein [Terriglobia bacterium]